VRVVDHLGVRNVDVEPLDEEVQIAAADRIVIPPETEPAPVFFDSPTEPTNVIDVCVPIGDVDHTVWHTVKRWHGPDDYELLEGVVTESKISSTDNNLNHDSMDVNFYVKPDPPYRRLLNSKNGQTEVEVEWERLHFPEQFRPSQGDRVSVVGYWIYDCAHGIKTEIHPPVMVAVHRPRAIGLPLSAGYGFNVHVPGIVTDIWIKSLAGRVTDSCKPTGLHQQGVVDNLGGPASAGLTCLPASEGFAHNPIKRIYIFNIHLPRSPHGILARTGKSLPPVPLYRAIQNPLDSGGPEPILDVRTHEEGATIRVAIDLNYYNAQSYSRRIVAGWAYAAPDNWGLRRWKLRVTSLDVTDDGDGRLGGDGDWRFWINTKNGVAEWTNVFDCNGCVHGHVDFDGEPYETGNSNPDRSLGPDLLLFPGQYIWLYTTGFEHDVWWEDSIGRVSELLPQKEDTYRTESRWGKARYFMNYEVVAGSPVGGADLSATAQSLLNSFELTLDDRPLVARLPPRQPRDWNHPHDVMLAVGKQPADLRDIITFHPPNREPLAFDDMSPRRFKSIIAELQQSDHTALDYVFAEVRKQFDSALGSMPVGDVVAALAPFKENLPPELWKRYFGDLKVGEMRIDDLSLWGKSDK